VNRHPADKVDDEAAIVVQCQEGPEAQSLICQEKHCRDAGDDEVLLPRQADVPAERLREVGQREWQLIEWVCAAGLEPNSCCGMPPQQVFEGRSNQRCGLIVRPVDP